MNQKFFFIIIISAFTLYYTTLSSKTKVINYTSPSPNSIYVKTQTNIVIKTGDYFDVTSAYNTGVISVKGSKSGLHKGKIVFGDNNKVMIFEPDRNFSFAETVYVNIKNRLRTFAGDNIEARSFFFITSASDITFDPKESVLSEIGITGISGDSLPANFPVITINYSSNPSDGFIFLSNITYGSHANTPYMIINRNSGEPYYYQSTIQHSYDFKVQPNGNLTYYNDGNRKFIELNNNYIKIDSFWCRNGYTTDLHELRLLQNGHAFLLSYDPQIVDMSQIVPGGNTAATVIGLILQELDENKNVVFQWRSWDHFQITDATHENFLSSSIDYVHGNAIEIDNDGNLMISSRHMDEITKIDHATGSIIWRLGGKNNQFTFINDPIKFSHQHAIRRISNGHITMFDNGNFHTPKFSRAVEYELDEINKTAGLIWEYRNNPSIYGEAMGNVQRLSNGNTLISWGLTNPTVTEVLPDGTRAYEITLPQSVYTYRAFRFDWNGPMVGLNENRNGSIPEKYKLFQNYPNPFNPVTTIKFEIPVLSRIRLSVYDGIGREILVLLNKELEAGSYSFNLDASGYSSGIYFYRLEANDPSTGSGLVFTETKKMVLVK